MKFLLYNHHFFFFPHKTSSSQFRPYKYYIFDPCTPSLTKTLLSVACFFPTHLSVAKHNWNREKLHQEHKNVKFSSFLSVHQKFGVTQNRRIVKKFEETPMKKISGRVSSVVVECIFCIYLTVTSMFKHIDVKVR